MMAYDDRLCTDIRALYRIGYAENSLYDKRKLCKFNIGSEHIGSLFRHQLSHTDIKSVLTEDMVYVHTYAESTDAFRKLHLVLYLGIVGIGLYYPDCLSAGICDLLKQIVFHHAAEIKNI